jgi:hypothetical protein
MGKMKRAITLVSYSTSNLHNVEAELQLRLDSRQKTKCGGNLVPLPEEAAQQQAETQRQRAERLAARLREMGENPDLL